MKKLLTLLLLTTITLNIYAQDKGHRGHRHHPSHEKMEELKERFIQNKLTLTETEAEKFWPLYQAYRKDVKALSGSFHSWHDGKSRKDIEKMTDKEAMELINKDLEQQRKRLELKERYVKEFGEILPPKKVALFFQLEIDFHKRLIKKLSARKEKRKEKKHP